MVLPLVLKEFTPPAVYPVGEFLSTTTLSIVVIMMDSMMMMMTT
jgi:hypothetical protein